MYYSGISISKPALTWLKYCRYGVKLYPINQSTMIKSSLLYTEPKPISTKMHISTKMRISTKMCISTKMRKRRNSSFFVLLGQSPWSTAIVFSMAVDTIREWLKLVELPFFC